MLFRAARMLSSARLYRPETGDNVVGHLRLNPDVFAAMTIGGGGTSTEYLQDRLRRAGRADLLEAIADGRISTYHAAEIAGIVRRRPTLGLRDHAAKRMAFAARGLK